MLYASRHDEPRVRNLVLLATPIDFERDGRDGRRACSTAALEPEDLVDETGNVPADDALQRLLHAGADGRGRQHATLLENLWNDEFVDGWQAMAQWSRDQVPFPGAAARQIVDDVRPPQRADDGRMQLGGREIDFATTAATSSTRSPRGTTSCRAAAAEPARRARRATRPPRTSSGSPGGHVTFSTGRRAFSETLPALTGWIAAHSDELDPRKEP